MKFKIVTLGCKVNTYESEFMLESLKSSGFIYCEENANIIIINTCSVTNMADSKSLKMVRRMKRENPDSIIVVAGCSSQNKPERYEELGVDILIGNKEKSRIVALINNYLKSKQKYVYFNSNRNLPFENMKVDRFSSHTRAFIKIQDGCDNFCSYCIIPYVRGSIRSKDFNETVEEVRTLVDNGHKEIVLTGIHTGSYNSNGHDLSDLLVEIAKIEDLERIRISSIEITELDDKFLNTLKNVLKIVDHLHIPLQSGSDNVLKRMNRKYDKEYFREKISRIRAIRPNISITTDAIVGHPYESEEDFKEYLDFVKEINFSKVHVFPYSMRSGTASSLMPQIDEQVKKRRAKELIYFSEKLEEAYLDKHVGKVVEIITEEYYKDYAVGHTPNYLKVMVSNKALLNCKYQCKIDKREGNLLYASILSCENEEISL